MEEDKPPPGAVRVNFGVRCLVARGGAEIHGEPGRPQPRDDAEQAAPSAICTPAMFCDGGAIVFRCVTFVSETSASLKSRLTLTHSLTSSSNQARQPSFAEQSPEAAAGACVAT